LSSPKLPFSKNNVQANETQRSSKERILRKKHRRDFFTVLIGVMDLVLINCAVLFSYYLRFHVEFGVEAGFLMPVPIAPLKEYFKALILIDYVFLVLFILFKLYRRERSRWALDELHALSKSLTIGYFFVTSMTFFVRNEGAKTMIRDDKQAGLLRQLF